MEFRSYDRMVEVNGEHATIKFPDPILVVDDFKIIDWKVEGDGFDQSEF